MATLDEKLEFLRANDADLLAHSTQTLLSHLVGVHDLLQLWRARSVLCDAGLFHSVYGTDEFHRTAISLNLRPQVVALIGEDAERLAYLFCSMDRLSLFANLIEPPTQFTLTRRDNGEEQVISDGEFRDLCELIVANWLEQRPRLPPERQFESKSAFLLMRPYLLPESRAALDEAYGFAATV